MEKGQTEPSHSQPWPVPWVRKPGARRSAVVVMPPKLVAWKIWKEAGPEGVAFDPIANFAYVTLTGTNQVAAVDLAARKIVAVGDVGRGPDGIAFSAMVHR